MTTRLPPRFRDRLDALACRVRRLRRLRGSSQLVLALALCAASAVLLDFTWPLPPVVRAFDLGLWTLLGASVAFVSLIRSSRRRLDPVDLAAVVEAKYPDLQECLTSSVEFSEAIPSFPSVRRGGGGGDERDSEVRQDLHTPNPSPPNTGARGTGETALVTRLVRETDEKTQALDFDAAVPAGSTRRLCLAVAIVLILSLTPAAFGPQEYGRLLGRFFLPWRSQADFAFVVHPGDTVAARGRPLAVTVTLVPRDPGIALPRNCYLAFEHEGETTRFDLVADADDPATYRVAFPVVASGRYRIEADKCVSASHTLTAITPTDLAPDSPVVVVTAPAEAASFAETQTLLGMVDITAFAGSTLAFRFAFDRPATATLLEWTPEGQPTQTIALPLSEDARSAAWSLRATQAGVYRLTIKGEHGIRTVREGGRIAIRPSPDRESAPMPTESTKKDAEAKERLEDLAGRQKELADRAAEAETKEEALEIAKAQAELARELDRLTKEDPALKAAQTRQVADLADDQRDLARASEETERKHDAERLAELAKRQGAFRQKVEALAKETATAVRANYARPSGDDASRAAESMGRGDTQKALDEQDRAAYDLARLGRDLARLAEAAKEPREAVRQLSRLQDDIARRVREEADKKEEAPLVDRLKDLLREQEALRQAVRNLDLPDKKAVEQQDAVEKALGKGDTKEALARMESARTALRESANRMKEGDKAAKASPLLPSEAQAKQARELAAEQRALRQETKAAAGSKEPPMSKDLAAQRQQQQARQEELTRRAGELGQALDKMPAAKEVRQAEAAMKAAQAMAKQGDRPSSQAQRERAAKALERAAAQMGAKPGKGSGKAGQSLQEARGEMSRAQNQLGKGPPQEASGAMRQAAARLRSVAGHLARGAVPGGAVDTRMFPKELMPHLGKRWGDLPGDLRTRLVQQMKARYGDDYARSIKLYFEQLADTRPRP